MGWDFSMPFLKSRQVSISLGWHCANLLQRGEKAAQNGQYIDTYYDSKLLGPVYYFDEPVKTSSWSFGQSNMHSTLDFYPRPVRKETNVSQHKRS